MRRIDRILRTLMAVSRHSPAPGSNGAPTPLVSSVDLSFLPNSETDHGYPARHEPAITGSSASAVQSHGLSAARSEAASFREAQKRNERYAKAIIDPWCI